MLQIRDVMTRDVLTVTPETTLRDAAELFARRHVSGAPVVVGEKVVGVVTATDLLDFVASTPTVPTGGEEPREVDEWALEKWDVGDAPPATYFNELWSDAGASTDERFAETGGPEWDLFAEHTVAEVMTRKAVSLAPDLPVTAAADYMKSTGVHRVLVLDQGRLLGIITSSDVTRAVAEHKIADHKYVFDRSVEHR